MNIPLPQQVLSDRVNEFTTAIKVLLDSNLKLPALVVLYSAVDSLGSLLRPESEPDSRGEYFRKWVDDYIIGPSQVAFRSEDLWAARCALLHTHTPASKLSRQGKARQVHYYRKHGPSIPLGMQDTMSKMSSHGRIFVDLDDLCGAFATGTRHFLATLQNVEPLRKRVLHHSAKLFGNWTYSVRKDQHSPGS